MHLGSRIPYGLCAAAGLVLAGCVGELGGGNNGPPGSEGLVSIAVTPGDATVEVDVDAAGAPQLSPLVYSAVGTYDDGHTADITSHVRFAIDRGELAWF